MFRLGVIQNDILVIDGSILGSNIFEVFVNKNQAEHATKSCTNNFLPNKLLEVWIVVRDFGALDGTNFPCKVPLSSQSFIASSHDGMVSDSYP